MSNITCPKPFLSLADFPATGGYLDGRLCAPNTQAENAFCCVPCPLQDLVYSDNFPYAYTGAFWVSVPVLVLMVFLLLTFVLFPERDGHGHYLNWGMVVAVTILELCFLVPLAAKPNPCYDAITPNDLHSSMTCAWSGALMLTGAMATVSWVLVRSLYTHLRIVWNIDLPRWFPVIGHVMGWGLPILFLAIAMPITGVSYQVTTLCLPKAHLTSITWFGWYLAFSGLAALLQLATTGYCIAIFALSFSQRKDEASFNTSNASVTQQKSGMFYKHNGWKRVKKVLLVQWRSIAMSMLMAFEAIYFGVTYLILYDKVQGSLRGSPELIQWVVCLIVHEGDKVPCLELAAELGIKESNVVASIAVVAFIGVVAFCLIIRWSMLESWYHAIREPRKFLSQRNNIEEPFIFVQPQKDEEAAPIELQEHELSAMQDDEEPLKPSEQPGTAHIAPGKET